jgi:hypothetical protein
MIGSESSSRRPSQDKNDYWHALISAKARGSVVRDGDCFLARAIRADYPSRMVIIRFPDPDTEKRALGFLAGRFSGKSFASGETVFPEAALAHLVEVI